jgi:hypothetical protein
MYGAGDLGSPGSENISCGPIVPTGQCNDGASSREVVPPNPGDLVITEFMADPSAVSDANGEWFEIYAASSFDLNGLEMGTVVGEVKRVVDDPECLRVEAGSYAVLANNGASEENGGLPAPITDVGFSLTNGASGIFVAHAGELLDAIAYSGTTAGVASALSSDSLSPEGNDDADNWCAATEIYGAGDRGTPGDANTTCGGGPSDGTCIGDDGPREIVRPQLGDLVITEFMANPTAVSDSAGEWFEVLATADVDLNGLAFGNEVGTVEGQLPVGGDCLHVAEDTRVVFARNGNSDMNGGLSAFATFSFSLIQDPSGIFLALPIQGTEDYETLDAITYTSTAAGASSSLDPDLENVTDNDNPANFCSATSVYNEPDLGTPGAENDPC